MALAADYAYIAKDQKCMADKYNNAIGGYKVVGVR